MRDGIGATNRDSHEQRGGDEVLIRQLRMSNHQPI